MAQISLQSSGGDLIEDNMLLLSHLRQRTKVLLLYDGVDDLDLIEQVLPPDTMAVHVLITTRCSGDHRLLMKANCVIRLGYLSPRDAVSALFSWARRQCLSDEELEYAMKMVASSLIQGLPLAIAHMGTFIRQAQMSCREYYELLESREEELKAAALDIGKLLQYFKLSPLRGKLATIGVSQPNQLQTIESDMINYVTNNPIEKQRIQLVKFWMNETNHVYLTWQFDIDSVSRKSPSAMRLLEFASLLGSRNIPGRMLMVMAFPDGGRLAATQFSLSIMELSSHTLISVLETNERYSCDIHALVQLTVFQRLIRQADDLHVKLTRLAYYLLQNMPLGWKNIQGSLRQSEFLELIPHVYSVAENILMMSCQNELCCDLVMNACWTALEALHVDAGYHLCEKQLEMIESLSSNSRNVRDTPRHVTGKCRGYC